MKTPTEQEIQDAYIKTHVNVNHFDLWKAAITWLLSLQEPKAPVSEGEIISDSEIVKTSEREYPPNPHYDNAGISEINKMRHSFCTGAFYMKESLTGFRDSNNTRWKEEWLQSRTTYPDQGGKEIDIKEERKMGYGFAAEKEQPLSDFFPDPSLPKEGEFGGETIEEAMQILINHAKECESRYGISGDALIEMAEIVLARHKAHHPEKQGEGEEEIPERLKQPRIDYETIQRNRIFYVDSIKKYIRMYDKEQISLSKFVELLNEDAYLALKASQDQGKVVEALKYINDEYWEYFRRADQELIRQALSPSTEQPGEDEPSLISSSETETAILAEKEIENRDSLIQLQEEYIKWLEAHVPFSSLQFGPTKETMQQGISLRSKIEALKSKI